MEMVLVNMELVMMIPTMNGVCVMSMASISPMEGKDHDDQLSGREKFSLCFRLADGGRKIRQNNKSEGFRVN